MLNVDVQTYVPSLWVKARPRRGFSAVVPCGAGLGSAGHATWDGGAALSYTLDRVDVVVAQSPDDSADYGERGVVDVSGVRVVYSAL